MRLRFVAASITTCIFACSRFSADDTSSVPAQDGGATFDASHDASLDAGTNPLAAVTYDRKDDFERDPLPAAGPLAWTEEAPNTTVASVIAVGDCDDAHCSPSHAVSISHDNSGAGYLATALGERTRSLRFDFSMKISRVQPQGGRVRMLSIEVAEGRVIFVQVTGDTLELGDKITTTEEHPVTVSLGTVTFDAWARYRLYVNLDAHLAAVARDAKPFDTTLTLRPEIVGPMARARLGITLVGDNFFQVDYDDVGIRELPTP